MPLYPYRCTKCGYQFEKIQNFTDQAEKECPECGGVLERPLTAPGLQFKGAGWYVNDYSRSGSSKAGEAKAGDPKAAESKPSTESKTGGDNKSSGESSASAAPAAAPAKSDSAKS